MMKRSWIFGIMIAATMLMCGSSFASPFAGDGIYSEQIYDTVAFTADTADPGDFAPAAKPDNSGIVNWRYDSWAMYAYLDTVPLYSETVPACGYKSQPAESMSKIPISKAV